MVIELWIYIFKGVGHDFRVKQRDLMPFWQFLRHFSKSPCTAICTIYLFQSIFSLCPKAFSLNLQNFPLLVKPLNNPFIKLNLILQFGFQILPSFITRLDHPCSFHSRFFMSDNSVIQCVQKFWSDYLNLVIFEVFGVKFSAKK